MYCTIDFCISNVCASISLLQLSLWDTAGVEQYKRTLTTNHYRYANVCVCVYDVTKLDTLDSLQYWLADAKLYGPQNLTFILCGNKIDLLEEDSNDEEKVEDVTRSAESLRDSFPHFSSHVLTSCKKAGKLETLKEEIAKQLLGQKVDKPKDIIIPGQNPGKNQYC